MSELKVIEYRGGILRFSVPSTWVEEYDANGGAMFYEIGPETGTLRLNILGFKSNREFGRGDSALSVLSRMHEPGKVNALPNGNAFAVYFRDAVEEGERLRIYYWELANLCPPRHTRIAIFSFTILESQSGDPE